MRIRYEEFAKDFRCSPLGEFRDADALHITWKFPLQISAKQLWPSVCETSMFNRDLGLAARTEKERDGKKVVQSKVIGFQQEWVEEPWNWVREKSMESLRFYKKGMAKAVRANFFLVPTPDGVDFYVNFSWIPQNLLWHWLLKLTAPILEKKFVRTLTKIEKFAKDQQIASAEVLKIQNNFTVNVNLPELEKARTVLLDLKLNSNAVEKLIHFIKSGDDVDLYRIRVIDLARNWNIPKRDVLLACMHAVRQGILYITWDIICPHCRGVRVAATDLGKISARSECLVCDIDFETDSLESIEVTFHVQPHVRKVVEVLFCAAEPAKKDHILIQSNIAAHKTAAFRPSFSEGRHRIRLDGEEPKLSFEVHAEAKNEIISWDMQSSAEHAIVGPQSEIHLSNPSGKNKSIAVEQLWWKDNILHPAEVFSIQDFQDVFSRESLNAEVKLFLGRQVVLFTDIVNSTGFYIKSGDAAAFNEVKSHFQAVFERINKFEGAVIKTIGDSVMACFLDLDKAVQAAIEIHDEFKKDSTTRNVRLRISMHIGNVIAVHLSQGLDLFGMTVNKAAKLQACANAGEISMTTEVFEACEHTVLKDLRPFIKKVSSVRVSSEIQVDAFVLNCHHMREAQLHEARDKADAA